MFDTNIFSNLIQGTIRPDELPSDGQCWATAVQFEELKNTPDAGLRSQLLSRFKQMIIDEGTQIPAGFAVGVLGAGFGQGEWRPNGSLWHLLKDDLDAAWDKLPNKKRKRNNKSNNLQDASIAEAAFHNGLILVTCDGPLATVAEKHGIEVLRVEVRKINIA
jgi:predicted nucleic acid-binding protein